MRVVFPTPDEPSRQYVFPAESVCCNSSNPIPVILLSAITLALVTERRSQLLIQFLRGDQVRLREEDHRFHLSVRGHDQVSIQPTGIKVKMAGLNNKSGIDVSGNHLEIDVLARGLAPQERLARKHLVDDRGGVIVVIVRCHPISDTGQVDGTINLVRKLPGQLRWDFSRFIFYEVGTAIHGGYASKAATIQA